MTTPRVLVLIPARGGSKGIPRKNLRALAGRPLIAYAIEAALASAFRPEVVVSSDDEEILAIAAKLGAATHRRSAALSNDDVTLDAVVIATVAELEGRSSHGYDVIVTFQPTSPLLSVSTLDQAIGRMLAEPALDTLLTAVDDAHLTWSQRDGRYVPNYESRVNRQFLEPVYRETGGLIVCRARTLVGGSRIGSTVSLLPVSGAEAIDIDTREDWALSEWYLRHRDVLFVVAGSAELGLGHVYNTLTLANELVRHRVRFLVTADSTLAFEVIAAQNYEVHIQRGNDLIDDVVRLRAQVVINDRLDTDASETRRLKAAGIRVVSIEDLGSGAIEADLVINAIYPERDVRPRHYYGPAYFCLRQQFALTRPRAVEPNVRDVLVTFGGVDPANLTAKVVAAIHAECLARDVRLSVIAGRGYQAFDSLESYEPLRIDREVANMADRVRAADLAFTSAGRTVFEIAAIGTPAIVLAQNDREMTHLFASQVHGFEHLGLGTTIDAATIRRAFVELVESVDRRRAMQQRMLVQDLRSGTARVVGLIEDVLDDDDAR